MSPIRSRRFLAALTLGLVPLASAGSLADGPPPGRSSPPGRHAVRLDRSPSLAYLAAARADEPRPAARTTAVNDQPTDRHSSQPPDAAFFEYDDGDLNDVAMFRSIYRANPQAYDVLFTWAGAEHDILGLTMAPADRALRAQLDLPEGQGVVVASVASGGPAEQVGLRTNDILLTLDGKPIGQPEQLGEHLKAAGEKAVELTLIRGGKPMTIRVRPQARVTFAPAEPEAPEFFIGVSVDPVDATLRSHLADLPEGRGLVVTEVVDASPASAAGVRPGDILLSFGDTPLDTLETLSTEVQGRGGKATTLTLVRAGKATTLEVTPRPRERTDRAQTPQDAFQQYYGRALGRFGDTWNLIGVPPGAGARDLNRLSLDVYGMPASADPQGLATIVLRLNDQLQQAEVQRQEVQKVLSQLQDTDQGRAPDGLESRLKELTRRVEELARAVDELRASLRKEVREE